MRKMDTSYLPMPSLFAKCSKAVRNFEPDRVKGSAANVAIEPETRPARIRNFLAWTFGGGFLTRGAVLVTTLIAARALNPQDFGEYVGLCAVALLAAGLWDLGLTALAVIELSSGAISTRAALTRIAELRLKAWGLWIGILCAGYIALDHQRVVPGAALLWFAAYSLCAGASNLCASLLQARLAFRAAALVTGGGRWVTALVTAFALPSIGLASGLPFLGFAAFSGEAVIIALGLATLRWTRSPYQVTSGRPEGDAQSLLTVKRSIPFAANGLLAMVYNRLDVLIVSALSPAGGLARYAPASRLQDALYLIPGSLQSVAFPIMSRAWSSANDRAVLREMVWRFTKLGMAISVPASVLSCIFAPQLLGFVLGTRYVEASTAVRIIVWFLPFAAISMPMIVALAASGRAADTTKIFVVTTLSALGMHLALDWHFGAAGGACATLFRDPCTVVAALILARRHGCALELRQIGLGQWKTAEGA
jgi:lipopolysaccharide exporter